MLSSEDVHSAKTMSHVSSLFFQVQPGDELVELEVDKNGNRDSAPGECFLRFQKVKATAICWGFTHKNGDLSSKHGEITHRNAGLLSIDDSDLLV